MMKYPVPVNMFCITRYFKSSNLKIIFPFKDCCYSD